MTKLYEEIKNAYDEYLSLKEQANAHYSDFLNFIKALNEEELEKLTYSELKQLYSILPYEKQKRYAEFFQKKKMEACPEFKKAVYYPELNEIDFLTKKKIKEVDNFLKKYFSKPKTFLQINCIAWRKLKLSKDEEKKLLEFMCKKEIFKRKYQYVCKCGNCRKIISEKQYNFMKKVYVEGWDDYTYEEQQKYNDGLLNVYCDEDSYNDVEIYDKESFEKYKPKILYQILKMANINTDSL